MGSNVQFPTISHSTVTESAVAVTFQHADVLNHICAFVGSPFVFRLRLVSRRFCEAVDQYRVRKETEQFTRARGVIGELNRRDFDHAKARYRIREGRLHVAVVGVVRELHKTDFVHALCRSHDPTRISSNSMALSTGYESARSTIWYAMPNADTQNSDPREYFKDNGLYVFDCIVILLGEGCQLSTAFSEFDRWIVENCKMLGMPTFVVDALGSYTARVAWPQAPDPALPIEDLRERVRAEVMRRITRRTRDLRRAGLGLERIYALSWMVLCEIAKQEFPRKDEFYALALDRGQPDGLILDDFDFFDVLFGIQI